MQGFDFYSADIPPVLRELAAAPALGRLKNVGMNCGCEYTRFPRFIGLAPYSRYTHSLGAGLITWHFTGNEAAAAAALLHDVATPVFAHTVDFLNGDHEKQESTEDRTYAVIASSKELMSALSRHGLSLEQAADYHIYPVADNDAPRLSADRLEYTLGNAVNFGFADAQAAKELYGDIRVTENEEGESELAFLSKERALAFGRLSLACSRVYTSPEDRYAMQRLSELLKTALTSGALSEDNLYLDEPAVIRILASHPATASLWRGFTGLSRMVSCEECPENARVIPAKKRRIDPIVIGRGRLTNLDADYRRELAGYMDSDFTQPISAR